MRTCKPFSTISYNSDAFLESKCKELIQNGILDFVVWITHAPEEDELKEHKHIYFRPASSIDTARIKLFLEEPDPKMPDKPLGCTIFKSSRFDDWYLYAIHDKAYLASKGQTRKYHYVLEQFSCSDWDFFREEINCIDRSKFVGIQRLVDAVDDGLSFNYMVRMGMVPVQLISQYKQAYDAICSTAVNRAGRETHTPISSEQNC